MIWNELKDKEKFTPVEDVFKIVGRPKSQLVGKPVYDMGKGILISYCNTMFKVENNQRIEYGEDGKYSLNFYYFQDEEYLKKHFKIKELEPISFDKKTEFDIVGDITTNSSFEEVQKYCKENSKGVFFRVADTNAMNEERKFEFQNKTITWGSFTFFFFGKSKKTKLSGYRYTLSE